MNKAKEYKNIFLSSLICISILVSYEILYAVSSYTLIYNNPTISDSKLDTISTGFILLVSLVFIKTVNSKKAYQAKENKILTFKKFKFKNYLVATIFVIAMMSISNIWLIGYETITGDTSTMEEVNEALVSDLDKFKEDEHTSNDTSSNTSSNEDIKENETSKSNQSANDSYLSAYLWVFCSVVLIGAITEEIIMRGICYKLLRKYSSPSLSIFLSATTFGIFHGNIAQGVYTFLMGLFLAILYYATKDFRTVCYAHLLNNFLFTLPKIPSHIEDMILNSLTNVGYVLIPLAIYLAVKMYKDTKNEEAVLKLSEIN